MKASDITSTMITQKGDLVFDVKSSSSDKIYKVCLGQEVGKEMPECECRRSHLPCQHLCAVVSVCQDLNWNSLPAFYINNALFVIDEECVNFRIPNDTPPSADIHCLTSKEEQQGNKHVAQAKPVHKEEKSLQIEKSAKKV